MVSYQLPIFSIIHLIKVFYFSFSYSIIRWVIELTVEYVIIGIVILIILLAILKIGKKDAHLELNKLVDSLGGKNNIIETETNLSRFKVRLKDISLVNKDAIIKLGAKGIVEIDDWLKIILGNESKQLKKYIDDLK